MKSLLEAPDRWQVQAAERVTVELAVDQVVVVQQQVVNSACMNMHPSCHALT